MLSHLCLHSDVVSNLELQVYRAQYGRDIVAAKKYKDGHFHRKS